MFLYSGLLAWPMGIPVSHLSGDNFYLSASPEQQLSLLKTEVRVLPLIPKGYTDFASIPPPVSRSILKSLWLECFLPLPEQLKAFAF